MFESPQYAAQALREYIIRTLFPLPWLSSITGLITLLAIAAPLLFYIFKRIRTMQHDSQKPFPLMDLPPELREMVYMNLLEDPYYPPQPAGAKLNGSPFDWMLSRAWPTAVNPESSKTYTQPKQSNWIFLANKQIHSEYMNVVCKKATFHLTVSPHNYAPAAFPSLITESNRIWKIAPDTLKSLRKCDIKLVATSDMLGVKDPRNMKSDNWALARQMREELKEVENVHELNLHVKAIGDPLWNPLWIWYHASQSLKSMGSALSLGEPKGPQLNRITFSLDTWSPGENYLERDAQNGNQWAWWCMRGHCIGPDGRTDMAVREFCSKLYDQCRTCNPELNSDDEGDE